MLYLIGLGLDVKGISKQGLEAVGKASKVYLESYTSDFPYSIDGLEKIIKKKVEIISRERVENLSLIDEAKDMDIALLVYGSPLSATTHIILIQEAKKRGIECNIIHAGSILDGVAESGLQLYKFGKIASIPNFEAESFIKVIKDNLKINAHSLILIDIGLEFDEVINRLQEVLNKNEIKIDKLVVCSRLGTKDSKIYYNNINKLREFYIKKPYCIIIPGKLHFIEKDVLEAN